MHVCIFILYIHRCIVHIAWGFVLTSIPNAVPFPGVLDICMFKMIRNELKCTVQSFVARIPGEGLGNWEAAVLQCFDT